MKLSQFTTDGALDALCAITPYIYNITSDAAVVDGIGKAIDMDKVENRYGQFLLLADRAVEILPLLLKSHRADVYGILAVLNQRAVEEIAAQNALETIRQVREIAADEELRAFFRSFTPTGRNGSSAPSVPSQG